MGLDYRAYLCYNIDVENQQENKPPIDRTEEIRRIVELIWGLHEKYPVYSYEKSLIQRLIDERQDEPVTKHSSLIEECTKARYDNGWTLSDFQQIVQLLNENEANDQTIKNLNLKELPKKDANEAIIGVPLPEPSFRINVPKRRNWLGFLSRQKQSTPDQQIPYNLDELLQSLRFSARHAPAVFDAAQRADSTLFGFETNGNLPGIILALVSISLATGSGIYAYMLTHQPINPAVTLPPIEQTTNPVQQTPPAFVPPGGPQSPMPGPGTPVPPLSSGATMKPAASPAMAPVEPAASRNPITAPSFVPEASESSSMSGVQSQIPVAPPPLPVTSPASSSAPQTSSSFGTSQISGENSAQQTAPPTPKPDTATNSVSSTPVQSSSSSDDRISLANTDSLFPPPANWQSSQASSTATTALSPSDPNFIGPRLVDQTSSNQSSEPENQFTDLSASDGGTMVVAANTLWRLGIISGYPDKTFHPDQMINRAEMSKIIILARFKDLPKDPTTWEFTDTKTTDWFDIYAKIAASYGIITGTPDGRFNPDEMVTTAEFLKIVSTAFKLKSVSNFFVDVRGDEWFAPYAGAASAYNLLPDRTVLLNPSAPITRAEAAIAIYNLIKDTLATR